MSSSPMMKCGHAANGTMLTDDGHVPACVICAGIYPGAHIVDDSPPDLSGRTARCGYYGSTPRPRGSSREGPCRSGECLCEEPSDGERRLAFFEHRPDEEHDRFYCGCWGWN